jgi:hypothetical protein
LERCRPLTAPALARASGISFSFRAGEVRVSRKENLISLHFTSLHSFETCDWVSAVNPPNPPDPSSFSSAILLQTSVTLKNLPLFTYHHNTAAYAWCYRKDTSLHGARRRKFKQSEKVVPLATHYGVSNLGNRRRPNGT